MKATCQSEGHHATFLLLIHPVRKLNIITFYKNVVLLLTLMLICQICHCDWYWYNIRLNTLTQTMIDTSSSCPCFTLRLGYFQCISKVLYKDTQIQIIIMIIIHIIRVYYTYKIYIHFYIIVYCILIQMMVVTSPLSRRFPY